MRLDLLAKASGFGGSKQDRELEQVSSLPRLFPDPLTDDTLTDLHELSSILQYMSSLRLSTTEGMIEVADSDSEGSFDEDEEDEDEDADSDALTRMTMPKARNPGPILATERKVPSLQRQLTMASRFREELHERPHLTAMTQRLLSW